MNDTFKFSSTQDKLRLDDMLSDRRSAFGGLATRVTTSRINDINSFVVKYTVVNRVTGYRMSRQLTDPL